MRDINFSASQILHNISHQTRWAIQETTFYTFPFMWLLGGYAVWRENEHVREARILALIAVVLLIAYLLQADLSVEFIGERYYFEGFFAAAILAARGLQILASEHKIAQRAMVPMLGLFAALQLCQIALPARVFWSDVKPYWRVRAATEALGGEPYTIFFTDSEPEFVAKHFNLNRPDWPNASQIFLVDPGAGKRDSWACLTGHPKWVAIGYDATASKVTEEFGTAPGCAVVARALMTSGR